MYTWFTWHTSEGMRVYTHTHVCLLCLRDFWVVYRLLIDCGSVYFKLRNNKSINYNKPQTLSNMYALPSFLQFILSKSMVLMMCNEFMLRCTKNEKLWWQKKDFCWGSLFLFPMEALDTGNHQVFVFLKLCPFYNRMEYNFSVLLVSDICCL